MRTKHLKQIDINRAYQSLGYAILEQAVADAKIASESMLIIDGRMTEMWPKDKMGRDKVISGLKKSDVANLLYFFNSGSFQKILRILGSDIQISRVFKKLGLK